MVDLPILWLIVVGTKKDTSLVGTYFIATDYTLGYVGPVTNSTEWNPP
jgi:hypothetical protein